MRVPKKYSWYSLGWSESVPNRELTKELSSGGVFNLVINFTTRLLLHLYITGRLIYTPLALLLANSGVPKEWHRSCSIFIVD